MQTKVKLVSKGGELWESEDGRVMISYDRHFETYCEQEHPVRLSRESFNQCSDWHQLQLQGRGTWKKGYLCYLCPGDEIHNYAMWTVRVDGEWTDDCYETFAGARQAAEEIVGPMVLSRPRKVKPSAPTRSEPETTTDPTTGLCKWAKCGHQAEYDIDYNCYTCHQKP